jgi:succinyl-diaminopimelate desuccinylase
MNEIIEVKKTVWNTIDEREKDVIELCCDTIKIPSDNPPGDTTELAQFYIKYLEKKGIEVQIYEPKEGNPNIIATLEGSKKGPHLVLNGHMDQFIAEVGAPWSVGPYSGEVKEGRIYGRGSSDMKGGVAATFFSFCLMKELDLDLPGKLTLTLVSDEETGGRWGTGWILENLPDLRGDACLNAEPSGLTERIGEKGSGRYRLKAIGKPSHGAWAGYAGENAIMKMIKVLKPVEDLNKIKGVFNEEEEETINRTMEGFDQQYGHEGRPGMSQLLKETTVNIGVITGGSKVNIVPGTCEVEVDVRVPIGISWEHITEKLKKALKETEPSIKWEYLKDPSIMFPATYTSPNEEICKAVNVNATQVTGVEPPLSFTPGATDCRFYRVRNVPSVVYGPKAYHMAAEDEYITVSDLLTVTKVHAGTIIDYLNS